MMFRSQVETSASLTIYSELLCQQGLVVMPLGHKDPYAAPYNENKNRAGKSTLPPSRIGDSQGSDSQSCFHKMPNNFM